MPHVEAPQYTWVCQYCGLSSPGGTLHCANCGFPAHTSAFELERAKRLGSVKEFLAERHVQRENWRRKPLPKKVLVVAAAPLFAVGLILLQLASGWRSTALGAATTGASLLFLWLGR
jgi:uncharacterized membrane protein YvbJ